MHHKPFLSLPQHWQAPFTLSFFQTSSLFRSSQAKMSYPPFLNQTKAATEPAFHVLLPQGSSIRQPIFSGQVWSFYDLYNIIERTMICGTKLLSRCRKHFQTTTYSSQSLCYSLSAKMEHIQLRKRDSKASTKVEDFSTEKEQQESSLNEDMRRDAPHQEFLSFSFDFDEENGEMDFDIPQKREERQTADRLESR